MGAGARLVPPVPAPDRVTPAPTPTTLAIVGPTGVGKTALALALAAHVPLEVVSADSRAVYRWMDVGTAKPTLDEQLLVPHHLIDLVDPDEPYSLALYQRQALGAIRRIASRGRLPLLVGGAGLYCQTFRPTLVFATSSKSAPASMAGRHCNLSSNGSIPKPRGAST